MDCPALFENTSDKWMVGNCVCIQDDIVSLRGRHWTGWVAAEGTGLGEGEAGHGMSHIGEEWKENRERE